MFMSFSSPMFNPVPARCQPRLVDSTAATRPGGKLLALVCGVIRYHRCFDFGPTMPR